MTNRDRDENHFKKWYERNKKKFNADRKKKYQANAELRAKARQAAAEYRTRTSGDEPEKRNGLFTAPGAAFEIGVSAQTLRNWEAKGLIPASSHGDKHRLYTPYQVQLMTHVYKAVNDKRLDDYSDVINYVFRHWNAE